MDTFEEINPSRGKPTHSISITALTSDPKHWDQLHTMFTEFMMAWAKRVPYVSISSAIVDEEDGADEETEYFDEFTLFKVVAAFQACKIDDKVAEQVINEMQNRGILFRERRAPTREELG